MAEHVESSSAGTSVKLVVDTAGFPLGIIRRTAFCFVEGNYVFFQKADDKHYVVTLSPKHAPAAGFAERAAEEFENEMRNQVLREKLMRETRSVRELVIGRALFSASSDLGDPFADDFDFLDDDGDFLEDPLGIAVSWEDKYGKNKAGDDD